MLTTPSPITLPSQLAVLDTLDPSLGLVRVFDHKRKSRAILLKICETANFTQSAQDACKKLLKNKKKVKEDRSSEEGIWSPQTVLTTTSMGVFVTYEDRPSSSFSTFIDSHPRPRTPKIVSALKDIARAIDEIHSLGEAIGCIRPEAILVDDNLGSVLVDLRLHDVVQNGARGIVPDAPTVEKDRIAFGSILRNAFKAILESTVEINATSTLGAKRGYEVVLPYIDAPTRTCSVLLEQIEKELKGVAASIRNLRWTIVAEFPDSVQTLDDLADQFKLELPQTRRELAEIAAREELAKRQQEAAIGGQPGIGTVTLGATTASRSLGQNTQNQPEVSPKPAAANTNAVEPAAEKQISSTFALNVFLVSSVILALVIGYKINPFGPRPTVMAGPATSQVQVISTPGDANAKAIQLADEKLKADSPEIKALAPKTWHRLEAAYDSALKLNAAGSESEFIEEADKLIVEYAACPQLVIDANQCQDLQGRIASIHNGAIIPHLQRLAPADYLAARELLVNAGNIAASEKFTEALPMLLKAHDALENLGKTYRLKAAQAETDPAARIALLSPLLDHTSSPPEVFVLAAQAIKESPKSLLPEAERRLLTLQPIQQMIARCEITRLAHQLGGAKQVQDSLANAVKAVSVLPDPQQDNQAVTSAIYLLETAAECGDESLRRQAAEAVSQWVDSKLNDPFDAAMIAGWSLRLGDVSSWQKASQRSVADVNFADFVEDIVATNLVTAAQGGEQQFSKMIPQLENAPLAAALAAYSAVQKQSTTGKELLEFAQRTLSSTRNKDGNATRAEELIAATTAIIDKSTTLKKPSSLSRLSGTANAAMCESLAAVGDMAGAQKAWSEIPDAFMLKSRAAAAFLHCGRKNGWTPEQLIRWALSQKNELDKTTALLALAMRPTEAKTDSTAPTTPQYAKLEPGTVLEWRGVMAKLPAASASITNRRGGFGGGAPSNQSRGSSRQEPTLRLFVRNMEKEKFSAFLESTPDNQLSYFAGTYENGLLSGEMTPIIPLQAGDTLPTFTAWLIGNTGIAFQSRTGSGQKIALAGIDLNTRPAPFGGDEEKAIEELETRFLVSHLANGLNHNGDMTPVGMWKYPPVVFIDGSKEQIASAMQSWDRVFEKVVKKGVFGNAKHATNKSQLLAAAKENNGRFIELVFAKPEKEKGETKDENDSSNFKPYHYNLTPSGNKEIAQVSLLIDPSKFTSDLERLSMLEFLWAKSIGFGVGRDRAFSLAVDSAFTDFKRPPTQIIKPLTLIDQQAIRVFLEELSPGQTREQVMQQLFEKRRDLWKFGPN